MTLQAIVWAALAVWAPAATVGVLKLFPGLATKLLVEGVEQRNRKTLTAFKDELDRASSLAVEHAKGEIMGSYGTLKTSMDFLSASQSGLRSHSVDAVKALWGNMVAVREAHSALLTFEQILTEEEKQSVFSGADSRGLHFIESYRAENTHIALSQQYGAPSYEAHRPFCGERLWLIHVIHRNVLLRSGFLTHRGLVERSRVPLLDDTGVLQLLGAVLSSKEIDEAKRLPLSGLATLLGRLEAAFLQEAVTVMSGSKAVAEALSDLQTTLLLQNDAIRRGGSASGLASAEQLPRPQRFISVGE